MVLAEVGVQPRGWLTPPHPTARCREAGFGLDSQQGLWPVAVVIAALARDAFMSGSPPQCTAGCWDAPPVSPLRASVVAALFQSRTMSFIPDKFCRASQQTTGAQCMSFRTYLWPAWPGGSYPAARGLPLSYVDGRDGARQRQRFPRAAVTLLSLTDAQHLGEVFCEWSAHLLISSFAWVAYSYSHAYMEGCFAGIIRARCRTGGGIIL